MANYASVTRSGTASAYRERRGRPFLRKKVRVADDHSPILRRLRRASAKNHL